MDNGYTWSYSMELDPSTTGSGQANNDDTQLSLTMNDMGTIKVCVSECGNNKKYKFDQSAYTNMSDTGTSYGIAYPGASGDANSNNAIPYARITFCNNSCNCVFNNKCRWFKRKRTGTTAW